MAAGSFNAVVARGDRLEELAISIESPNATVADLLASLGIDQPCLLVDEEQVVPGDHALGEVALRDGVILRGTGTERPRARPHPGRIAIEVVGGLESGNRADVGTGSYQIGRSNGTTFQLGSEAVSAVHAAVEVDDTGTTTIADQASFNGTWLNGAQVTAPALLTPDDLVRIGNAELRVRPVPDDAPRLDHAGHLHASTLPFNRPPRTALPEVVPPVPVPEAPKEAPRSTPFSIFLIIGPLLFAGVMVQVMGSIRYAIFAVLSPVMALGNYFDNRRRRRKTTRKDARQFADEVAAFQLALAAAAEQERLRREQVWPHPAEVCRRADLPSTRLWERRAHADDFLVLRVASGPALWEPPVSAPGRDGYADEVQAVIDQHQRLPHSAVPLDLRDNGVVGLVGDRTASLAVARSLIVQAAVLSGPADLVVAVFTSAEQRRTWDWVKWLPHAHDPDLGSSFLASDREEAAAVISRLTNSDRQATVLVVVDDLELLQGRRAPVRQLLAGQLGPVAGIVCAPTDDRLPAMVSAELHLHDDLGRATFVTADRAVAADELLATGMRDDTARRCARRLARFEDPELAVVAADLPDVSRLIPLLGLDALDADAIVGRWKARGPHPSPSGPIGVTADDVFDLDLVRDGPHGLVGGTTGSGKSELLRSMVAGLAASADPDHLTFVLIDFKGGSAFEACARLPHTVGMVTDLDEHLAERALRCLEAELQHRERVLRDAGVGDLPEYLRGGHGDAAPLPRLVVVIDEFATMKDELPDFIDALVGIAQRGRSLGVHMILATQRPSGAVSENIKANTNLRIALRVQDAQDSVDVIGNPDAAKIPRGRHGRAYIRLGPSEVVPIQSAWSMAPPRDDTTEPIETRRFAFGASGNARPTLEQGEVTELDLLVAAINDAQELRGGAPPRRPWPDPLEEHVDLAALPETDDDDLVPFALGDDPDHQRQITLGWRPSIGNLLLYGIGGAGTTTALGTIALSLAARRSPESTHLYVLDLGAGELAALADLPHTGAYITAQEGERRMRLLRHLRAEMARRRSLGPPALAEEPDLVVVIDSMAPFMAEFDEGADRAVIDSFVQLVNAGGEVGIRFLLAADRAGAVAGAVAATVRQRVVLRLADQYAYSNLGVPGRHVPDLPPGRGFHLETGLLAQIAETDVPATVEQVRARWKGVAATPAGIETLGDHIPLSAISTPASLDARPWSLPIALAESTLQPVALTAYLGEHIVVGGPARSGRTTALATIGTVAQAAGATVVGVAGTRSPLAERVTLDRLVAPADLASLELPATSAPLVVLVDDADAIEDAGALLGLLTRGDVLVAAAGRSTTLRKGYNHWTRALRDARLGVLLMPDVDLDGELLGTRLPRRSPVAMVPGRGYVVNGGEATLAQVAMVADAPAGS